MSGAPKEKKKVLLCTIREKIKDGSPNKRCTSTEPSIYGPFTNQVNQELRLLFEEWKTLRKNADLPTSRRFLFWFVSMQKRVNFTTGDIDALVQEKKKPVKEWAKGAYATMADLKKKLEEVKEIFTSERRAAIAAGNVELFEEGRYLSSKEQEDGPAGKSGYSNEMNLDQQEASPAAPAPSTTPLPSACLVIFLTDLSRHLRLHTSYAPCDRVSSPVLFFSLSFSPSSTGNNDHGVY